MQKGYGRAVLAIAQQPQGRAPLPLVFVPQQFDQLRRGTRPQVERLELDEEKFRYLVNDNAMATDKTSEGIRKFAADVVKLEKLVAEKLR